MSRVVRIVVGAVLTVAGVLTGNFALVLAGAQLLTSGLFGPKVPRRAAAAAQLQLGEQPRQAIFGRAAVAGSLVDAFNYGGRYGTDWEVLVIALADHRCDALEGFFVDDTYVTFTGDGNVAGFNSQLQVFWRDGQWAQSVPSILTTNGPGWTANDRGRGVAYVVVAYKADASDARNPVWPSGRPRFRWVVRGLRCYQARKDSTVGGSGAHRRDNPATWEWTENPIDIRYNWVRGIYAGDLVDQPGMLLIGRGLSAIEAPPANVFPRANLCDEVVGGAARYRIGGLVAANEAFIDVESDFAVAVAGTISQPEGAVEVNPGEAKAAIAHFTDADLIVGSTVRWSDFLGQQDDDWVNTVAARYIDPAQRWTLRGAPVRRDLADVIADGGPRELQPQLDFVTNGPQAQRIAEIIRRFGRLWGRGTVTLPPRFAFIEEGDWVTWQSDRHFGGATLTFRVEAWGSDAAWHHQLTLRQISASVFSDTAPLTDGSVASNQPAPPVVAVPGAGVWNATAVLLGSGSVRVPNLRVAGTPDDPAAQFVVFEYVPQVAAPDAGTIWTFAASSRPDVRLLDIPVIEGGTYWVAVSYVVEGIQGARRVLGPLSTSGLSFADGSPVAPVAPANANRVPFSRFEGGRGWFTVGDFAPAVFPIVSNGRYFICAEPTFTAASQNVFLVNTPRIPVRAGERLSVSAAVQAFALSGGLDPNYWHLYWEYYTALDGGTQVGITTIAQGFTGINEATRHAAFSTVPATAQAAQLVLRCESDGAGPVRMAVLEPMVASAAEAQTVHPPYAPGPNAVDGALPNNLITIDGSGNLQGIGSGAGTTVNNALVPLGANAVVNSEFTRGKFGWRWRGGGNESDWGVNLTGSPNWFGQRNVMWATQAGALAINANHDLAPNAIWGGAGLANALLFAMPVVQGDRLAATVLAAEHRCTFQLYILFFDASGTLLAAPVVGGGTELGAANGDPANFTRLTVFGDAPANARWAIPMMRMLGTGESDPFIFFTEPMLSKVATGQTVAPRYVPGRADPNSDVTATVSGPADLVMQFRADLSLLSPLPLTADYQLGVAGAAALTSGVSWSVAVVSGTFAGAAPSIVGTGTGQLRINSALTSPEAMLRVTPSVEGRASPPFVVTVRRQVAAPSVAAFTSINSASFTIAHDQPIQITLPSGVSSVALTAVADLFINPEAPVGGSTVEGKWQRETSPGTWADVGAVATSSPNPEVFETEIAPGEFVFSADPGSITCNRTASGLTSGTIQRFRFVARVSVGNVREVRFNGNGSAIA